MAKPWLADQVKLLDRPLEPPKDASSAEKKAVATLEAALSAARKPLLQPEILSQVRGFRLMDCARGTRALCAQISYTT